MNARFYFDPTCPWTWMTSRWLVDVANQTNIKITWRTFSLQILNEGQPIPPALLTHIPDLPARLTLSEQALRIIESLRDSGRNEEVGRFYTEWGIRFHVRAMKPDRNVLEDAAKAAGVMDKLAVADDDSWDTQVRASLEEAVSLAGPDVGSPVIVLDGNDRGAFGPIVSPPPTGEEAVRLWDAVVTLHSLPTFLEIKRGRSGPPAIPS